uniref:DUF2971 domain-containing protein n=1 Tax=Flavobacterium sp. TaxID=239 RepID=UPI00404A47C4
MSNNQEFTYQEFIYKLEGGNHEVIHDKKEPETFFKYYSVDNYKIDALLNNYLYASHPYSFNDSIDSSEMLVDYTKITKEIYKSLYTRVISKEELAKYNFDELFEHDKLNSFSSIRSFFFQYFSRQIGLISLTTEPLNILMWSHYSTESGFVIEIDKKKLLENMKKLNSDIGNYCLRPIQYVEHLESIDMFREEFKTPDIPFFLYMTSIKRLEWKYEDEWRLSIYKKNMGLPMSYLSPGSIDYVGENERKLFYPREAIKNIILGKYFFNGSNTSKINADLSFELKSSPFLDFVNHIFENYNDRLYMSGELEKENKFNRSVERIELEKIDCKTFKIIQKHEGFYRH